MNSTTAPIFKYSAPTLFARGKKATARYMNTQTNPSGSFKLTKAKEQKIRTIAHFIIRLTIYLPINPPG